MRTKAIQQAPTKTAAWVAKPTEVEDDVAMAKRELTYSAGGPVLYSPMADAVKRESHSVKGEIKDVKP